MESSDILNCAIRVKEEPSDESPDSKNFPLLPFPPENSIQTVKKCEENLGSELDDEVEIIVECEDVKSNIRSLALLCRCLGSLPLYKSAMSRSYIPTLCSILSDFFE
ncbi:hypothetical protein TKK_0000880 [Trichogramma kaykai]